MLVVGCLFSAFTVVADEYDKETGALIAAAIIAEGDEQISQIEALSDTGSDLVADILTKWRQGRVLLHEDASGALIPFVREDDSAFRVDNGELIESESTTSAETSSQIRRSMRKAIDFLALSDPSPSTRSSAIIKLSQAQNPELLPVLERKLETEQNSSVQRSIRQGIAIIQLANVDTDIRIAAIEELADQNSMIALDLLKRQAADENPQIARAGASAVRSVESYVQTVDFLGTIFRGISLGSILLVVALGLAITFGLMGVINMAHGEMMVVGAYTTYMVHNIFGSGLYLTAFGMNLNIPGIGLSGTAFEMYFVVAIPLSFLTAALVGIGLERSVIRFLYTRPLESLMATWGVSLVLQQLFRMIFGSNNVQVYSPSWLSGTFMVHDVSLGWNRLFVIGFAVVIVLAVWLLLTRTPLGLLIRAVMQNREMAACMGVRTERVNMLTFGLGSGLAGLAGAFLSQIGNVGPSLGQSYIVDCFMTVVVGGVGNIVGTVVSAMSIGIVDQTLQPILGPVMGKITVLVAIILFLQWKPGGLFPSKSRSLEG